MKEAKEQWNDIFNVLKANNCQLGTLCTVKIVFKVYMELKRFQTKPERIHIQQKCTKGNTTENSSKRNKMRSNGSTENKEDNRKSKYVGKTK